MKYILCIVAGICMAVTTGFGQGNTPVTEVKYSFAMQWRLGAPVFSEDRFSTSRPHEQIIFVGRMAPRGMLILQPSSPAEMQPSPSQKTVTLRGPKVDISSYLQIEGAHYRKHGEEAVTYVPPEKLPKLKVGYEPLLPDEIDAPGKQNCVLLFEVGEGKQAEWAEGYWSVSISFDGSKLGVELIPAGTGAVEVKGKDGVKKVVYRFSFVAKTPTTKADEHNLAYFQYRDLLAQDDVKTRRKALEPLNVLIEAYPTETNFLYARATLLAEQGEYAEAVKDIQSIQALVKENKSRSRFEGMVGYERMKQEDVTAFLDALGKTWSDKAASQPSFKAHAPSTKASDDRSK